MDRGDAASYGDRHLTPWGEAMRKRLATATVVSLLSGLLTGGVAEASVLEPVLIVTPAGAMTAELSVDPGPSAGEIESITYDSSFGFPRKVEGNASVTYSYVHPGTYDVSAVVVDVDGNRATATATYTTEGSGYAPFGPSRFLDTRTGLGAPRQKLGPRGSLDVQISGREGIPPEATAVAINITVTNATAAGWVVAYPWGRPRPNSSIVDYTAGTNISNATIVGIAPADINSSGLTLYNGGAATIDVIVDVTGYFIKSGSDNGFESMIFPERLLDTRTASGGAPLAAGATIDLNVETDEAPVEPTAAVLNVTAVSPARSGHVTAFPAGSTRPTASSLNFPAGRTVANLVIVPVTSVGDNQHMVSFHTNASTHLIVDVAGYFGSINNHFVPINPSRVIDTRRDLGLPGPLAPLSTNYENTGTAAPANLGSPDGIIGSAKVVNATRPGFLRAHGLHSADKQTSLLNFTPGTITGNVFMLHFSIGTYFHNGSPGTVDLVADVSGYFYFD